MKTCVICGREFEPRKKNQLCCSPECSHAHDREISRDYNARRRALERTERRKPAVRRGYDADGRHLRFRERAMKAKPWLYEFADSPELLS